MSKDLVSRILLVGVVFAFGWSLLLFLTGGFIWEAPWFRLASRDPFRPLVVAVVCAWAYRWLAPAAVSTFVERVEAGVARRGAFLAGALGMIVAIVGFQWSTYVAGSADSYGYVSQADLWLTGHLRVDQRWLDLPPPFDDWVVSPLGYQPGPEPHTIVPRYSPGLPILMAAAKAIVGQSGPYFIVPLLGGLCVFLTYCIGRLLYDELVGVAAALLMAVSPAFQFQLMWPMSDVPVATAWSLALAFAMLRRSLAAGLASGLAIVIRPNLSLLTGGIALITLWPEVSARANVRQALSRLLWFGAGVFPAVAGIALFNDYLYGGPLVSGYGGLTSIYHWEYFGPNVSRYSLWLLQMQTPFVFAAALPLASRRFTLTSTLSERPHVRAGLALFLILLAASYLWYLPFDDWWYLRFLLPGFPVLLALAVGALRSTTPLIGRINQQVLLGAVVVAVFGWELSTAQWRGVYTVQNTEQRYVTVGRDLGTTTPTNAVFLAMQHSGSLRYYSGRLTVRYDSLPPGSLDAAIAVLRGRGFHPYFLLERWEEAAFRERFSERSAAGRIDWPPTKKWVTPARIALYDPADRAKFVRQ